MGGVRRVEKETRTMSGEKKKKCPERGASNSEMQCCAANGLTLGVSTCAKPN